MIDKIEISNALYDIFLQAHSGKIEIDTIDHIPYTFNVQFMVSSIDLRLNTVEDDDPEVPTLHLDNIDTFVEALLPKVEYYYKLYKEDYSDLDESNMVKMICSSFFFNMTYFDFINPVAYIKNLPESNPIENVFDITLQDVDYRVLAVHRMNALNLETIDCLKIVLKNDSNIHQLPSVSYQINGNKAVIKSIQAPKDNDSSGYITPAGLPRASGTINNHLRNINPSTLLSLTIAIKTLREEAGVTEISIPTLLPIRYNGLIETLTKKEISKKRRNNEEYNEEEIHQQAIMVADKTQFNITNKLSNTIARFVYHLDNYEIIDYGEDSFMITIKERDVPSSKNDILHNIFNAPSKKKSQPTR